MKFNIEPTKEKPINPNRPTTEKPLIRSFPGHRNPPPPPKPKSKL